MTTYKQTAAKGGQRSVADRD